ncbi:MAG: HAD-IC family P-type ATPase [Treponema sp.]|nr:MAG: HAD-IC family P-type ATPase [Treponema sp.]
MQNEHIEKDEHEENEISLARIITAGILLVAAEILEHIKLSDFIKNFYLIDTYQQYIFTGICLAAYLLVGYVVVKSAVKNILRGEFFDEKFLMSVASLGAVCIGQLPEAVAIMLFYQIGERFEDYAVDKSEKSINALMEIRPDTANVIRGGKEITVKAEEVQPGETIVVKPGERIPVDGIITKGSSFLDNSAITGESVPVEITEGAEVFSGAINKNSAIEIRTVRLSEDSAASRIIKMVEFSSQKKTKTERFITRFSRIYTPAVCILALSVAIIPSITIGLSKGEWQWSEWVYRAISFLVVSCPCAIVISVPLTFFGGIGAASRNGILMKGSSSVEALSRIRTAVFDKTGTLTKGISR